jgi:Tfp pilus assembly protein FimT
MDRKHGFTPIELPVVIAVIALLVALPLRIFAQAPERLPALAPRFIALLTGSWPTVGNAGSVL